MEFLKHLKGMGIKRKINIRIIHSQEGLITRLIKISELV